MLRSTGQIFLLLSFLVAVRVLITLNGLQEFCFGKINNPKIIQLINSGVSCGFLEK